VSNRAAGTLLLLLRACHPEPSAAVTALTALLAVDAGHPSGTAVLVTSAVFTGQLSIGWSNDLVDAGRDQMVQRTDKPLAGGALGAGLVRVSVGVVLVACVVLSLLCGLRAGSTHLLLGVGSGWAYNLGLKRTVLSWLPYAVAFGTLPAVVWLALDPPILPPWWLMAAAGLLGVGAHLVNVVPDLEADEATGVRGFPHRLGRSRALRVATAVLVVASAVVTLGPGWWPAAWAWAALGLTMGLAALALWRSGRLAFRATVAIAAVDVLMLIAR
jgi:4-hydroxybenzoate polyprenyltransferase